MSLRRIARPLLASIFINEGIDTLRNPQARIESAEPALEKITEPLNIPIDATTAVRVNGTVMTVAGLALATGKTPRIAASILSASLVATTVVGHPFWSMRDKEERVVHRKAFTRNLVFLGGLLHAAVDTNGKPSRKWRKEQARKERERNS